MSDQTDFLDVRRDGAVAHIRLNRAAKANSMSWAFWTELPRVMKDLSEDTAVRAVVLSGAGKHFSAGMELSAFGSILSMLDEEPGRAAYALRDLILDLQRAVTTLEECRMPVIAAIQGACLGGAIDLITACDVRLASSDAFFAIEEINIGLTADVGTLQRLPSLIGGGLARELALTGRRFSAEEAKSWGLVNAVHEDHDALGRRISSRLKE